MTIDLTRAAVRPAGTDGVAARTAAGFIVLASRDAAPLVSFIEEHQTAPNLIELLAATVAESGAGALAMLFTAGGEPYLFAWGAATTSVTTSTSRFTVTPVAGELLVHPLAVDAESTVVLSNGPLDPDQAPAPINLAEGSMHAQTVVIDLAPRAVAGMAPADLPALDIAPIAATPEPAPDVAAQVAAAPDPQPPAVVVAEAPAPPAEPVVVAAEGPAPPAEPVVVVAEAPAPPAEPVVVVAEAPAPPADPTPFSSASGDATELLSTDDLAFGQPAAEGIVFADDLEEISDLIEPDVVPETQRIRPPESSDAVAGDGTPPVMPADGQAAEVPPEFVRDAQPAAPPIDPLETTPLPDLVLDPPTPVGAPAMVLGATCPNGHHNHPETPNCTTCGAAMPREQTVILVNGPRPALGLLVVDDGTTVSIDNDLIIGRDPMAHADVRSGQARPMTLTDETLALSRQHARIVLSDWSVQLVDLGSSNGTWVNRAAAPQDWSRVEPGTPVALASTDRLRIGGRVIQVELHHPG